MSKVHISGVLVHARSAEVDQVRSRLASIPGVDVHSDAGDGRLITIVECATEESMADTFTEIRNVEGVLSAAVTYHFNDELESLNEEIAS
jgi:nitrate reductase NapD